MKKSFSCLKTTCAPVRVSKQRLVNLAIISIEKELAQSLSSDEIVDKFAVEDKNRRVMLL